MGHGTGCAREYCRVIVGCVLLTSSVISYPAAAQRSPKDAPPLDEAQAKVLADIQQKLLDEFETFLKDGPKYRQTVRAECHPLMWEGDIFGYLFPVFAYTNLGLKDPKFRPTAVQRVAQLIDMAMPVAVERVKPPSGKLEDLKKFNKQGVYLGQLNLALGCYRLVGGDDRYDKVHRNISTVLHEAMVEREGRPLESYPDLFWPFDTIPCLLSLQLYDVQAGSPRSRQIIERHFKWVRDSATDKATGLPWTKCDLRTGQGAGEPPRGCDLSLRTALMAHMDREYAADIYDKYARQYWVDKVVIAGFGEWPGGRTLRQDDDSGPIVQGVGSGATGLGVAAAIAASDRQRLGRLCAQMQKMRPMLKLIAKKDPRSGQDLIAGKIPYRENYFTGFLLGDACLFYSVTWTPWPNIAPTTSSAPAAGAGPVEKGPPRSE
jgi:hypothetical protein